MSASSSADPRDPEHVATKIVRPADGRIAKLRLHLANVYGLIIKELRSFRSDPVMIVSSPMPSLLRSMPRQPVPPPKQATSPLKLGMMTVPICHVVLLTASRHLPLGRSHRLHRRKLMR